jgi:hypothetical protein
MSTSAIDARLVALLSGPAPATIAEVLARMRAIDGLLAADDGLKWFNWLYLTVTEEVGRGPAQPWRDGRWLERLDVVFGGLYFEAVRLWLTVPATCPRAWVPLFQARHLPGVARLQFGLAGMNAHINRDLAVALVRTCEGLSGFPRRDSAQHADYQRVNEVLEAAEARAVEKLATGITATLARELGRLDDLVAMWKVRAARDAAWTNAEVLWQLRGHTLLSGHYLATLDRSTGFAGRGLLIPTGHA